MAGEAAIATTLYPDDFQTISFSVDPGTAQYVPLFIADRDLLLDSATVRFETANGSALTGNLAKVADGVATSTNTDITTTNEVNFNTAATSKVAMTPVATENLIPSGNLVILEFSGAAAAGLGVVTIQMRVRSRRK